MWRSIDLDDELARALLERERRQGLPGCDQARPAQKGHAEPAEAALRERVLGEKRDDVRVPQPGQGQVLVLIVRNDLHDDRPIGQARVGSQKRPPGLTSPQLGQQQKGAEHLAGFGIVGDASRRPDQAIAFEERPAARPPQRGKRATTSAVPTCWPASRRRQVSS